MGHWRSASIQINVGEILQGSQCYCVSISAISIAPFINHKLKFVLLLRYMVDAADHDKIEASRNELHHLLDKPQLAGMYVSYVTRYSCLNSYSNYFFFL